MMRVGALSKCSAVGVSVRPFSVRSFSSASSAKSLKGKRALITGSTSGIGLGIAKKLAGAGCSITLNGFGNASEIDALQKSISKEFGVPVFYHGADIGKVNQIEEMIQFGKKKMGGIDILVNNAGIQHVSPVESFPVERWDAVLAINLTSVFHTIRLTLPEMKEKKWGRIVNISSVHGLVASIHKSAYVASKHGVVGLTKVVALETAGTGVTCNCINPGWVRTPLVEKQIEARAQSKGLPLQAAAEDLLSEKQPSKQFVSIDQLGEAALFLCSDSASQITGISLPVDGGWTSQ